MDAHCILINLQQWEYLQQRAALHIARDGERETIISVFLCNSQRLVRPGIRPEAVSTSLNSVPFSRFVALVDRRQPSARRFLTCIAVRGTMTVVLLSSTLLQSITIDIQFLRIPRISKF